MAMRIKIKKRTGDKNGSASGRKIVRKMKSSLKKSRSKRDELNARNIYIHSEGTERLINAPLAGSGKPGGDTGTKSVEIVNVPVEGIETEIPKTPMPLGSPPSAEERSMLKQINMKYPLIPSRPRPEQKVFSYANIRWSNEENSILYKVIEPFLSKPEQEMVEKIKRDLEEHLDIDFFRIGEIKAKELLREEIRAMLSDLEMDPGKMETIQYFVERDIIGLGKIEPIMMDPDVEDISCDGVGIPVYIYHRNPLFGSIKSNVVFDDKDDLDTFVMKIAQKCGKSISVAEPLVDGSLPDGSRIQATLATDIARKGSNFTIRKFTKAPLTPVHMVKYGTLDSTQMAYMWMAIENRKSILISGGTATGKTSLLNALSLFIRPNMKVVSIEDTPELRIPHPHWVPEVARTPISLGKGTGDVSLFDLLKGSLRQRPDYIIVGEVRGEEAYVLFQQIATGHSGLATMHAASIRQLMDRLMTPPISLPASLIENVDIIIFLLQARVQDKYVRRANEIVEVSGMKGDKPSTRVVFRWKPMNDAFESVEKSGVLRHISDSLGMTETTLKEEMRTRKAIIEWMKDKNITDYREVAHIINEYYYNAEKLIAMVEE